MDEEEFVELVLRTCRHGRPTTRHHRDEPRRNAVDDEGSVLARVLDSGSRRSSRSHCTFAPYPASLSNVSFETDRAVTNADNERATAITRTG